MERIITKEDAEKTSEELLPLIQSYLICAITNKKEHRNIGKLLAPITEIHVVKWLTEQTGRSIKLVTGEAYDAITDDDKKSIRIQIKFRMDAWHLETTRRNSKKNEDTNESGHIAYRDNEFDMLAIFIPGSTFGLKGSKIRCIPSCELKNTKKPGQLVTSINKKTKDIYNCDEKTFEVIKTIFSTNELEKSDSIIEKKVLSEII